MPTKRGAPKGNRNAFKHGFYSNAYTQKEKQELSQTGIDHRRDNIKFFKVLVARVVRWVKPAASNLLTFQENLAALHTLVLAISRIQSAVSFKQSLRSDPQNIWDDASIADFKKLGLTDEEIEQEIFGVIPPRKRGAQPGNDNARKHGIYAAHYTPDELRKLDDLDEEDVTEEIALLQILMKRVFAGLNEGLPLRDRLKAVRLLAQADACLQKLARTRGSLFGMSAWQDAIQEAILSLHPYKEL